VTRAAPGQGSNCCFDRPSPAVVSAGAGVGKARKLGPRLAKAAPLPGVHCTPRLQVHNALSLVPASNTQHAAAMYCPMRLRRMHTMCLSSHPLHVVGLPSHNDGANSDDGPQRATRSDSFTGDPGRDVTVSSTSCSFVSGDQLSRASVERYRTQASPAET
jgi:hypothetical protein